MNAKPTAPLITRNLLMTWVLFATVPFWIKSIGLYDYLAIEILIWSICLMGYNLALGHAGLPSFGHGMFFGVGAYAFGLTQFNLSASLWLCLLMAIVASMAVGLFVALFIAHRRGIYFALMTIAFGEVFAFITIKAHSITGGEDGLLGIKRPTLDLFGWTIDLVDDITFFYFVLVVFIVISFFLWRVINSPFGRIVKAIKQNEMRTRFAGYGVWFYKVAVLTLSAGITGLAGGLFALAQTSAFPDVMSVYTSGNIIMMDLIGGGLISFLGPVVGTVLFFLARDLIGAITTGWMLWFGLIFVTIVLFKPEGIAGIYEDCCKRIRRTGAASNATRS